jgi:diguanylate cyclase (GGDEF)-like protein
MSKVATLPGDAVPVSERFRVTQWLRLAAIGLVLLCHALVPDTLLPDRGAIVSWTLGFFGVAAAAEGLSRLLPRRALLLFSAMLMVDGIWLAWAAYLTGGTASPLRYAMLLHLGAVCLLASYRTGIKLAVWHSLLLFTIRNAIAGGVLTETAPSRLVGYGSADQRLAIFIIVLWLVAVSTSTLSAINERELRRRRGDLEALTSLAEQIERTDDSSSVARTLLDAAVSTFGFPRGVVLASSEGHLPLLASYGLDEELARRPGRPGASAVIAQAHEQKATVLVRGLDAGADPWLARLLPGATNLVVVPMSAEGRSLGALVVEHPGGARIQRRVVTGLERSASYAALALRNAWLLEQVQRLAATDGLTKIANRRTFEATLEREVARATRSAEHVSLVMVDIDYFKLLNDQHGHQAGDEVLRNVAAALSCECRDFDTAARYGGEEFAVILPGCGPDEAHDIAERLRLAVSAAPSIVPITASAGVATYPSHAGDADTLVRAADEALYASKHAGRDRTTLSLGIPPEAQVDALLRRAVSERLGQAVRHDGPDSGDALAPSPRRADIQADN